MVATGTGLDLELIPRFKSTINGHPSFLRMQCEASLYVDWLWVVLSRSTCIALIKQFRLKCPCMKQLVEVGKIKYIGLSECSAKTLRRAFKIHPISVVQMEYSLWYRGIEDSVLPHVRNWVYSVAFLEDGMNKRRLLATFASTEIVSPMRRIRPCTINWPSLPMPKE